MKKLTLIFILLLIITTIVLPARAMVGGELDNDEYAHTNVGAIVLEWPFSPGEDPILARLCTGTLIHERVLVSAAHCFSGLESAGLEYESLYVTFNVDAVPEGHEIDPTADEDYYAVAEYIKHPDFSNGKEYHDLALVILDENVPKSVEIEDLPEINYLGNIIQHNGKKDLGLDLIFVGYGADGLKELPDLNLDAIRRRGNTTYQNLLPLEILTSNKSDGDAVICQGDSGGPVFHVDSEGDETLVGVHSRSGSFETSCDGLGLAIKYRLDTDSAQTFINNNLPDD